MNQEKVLLKLRTIYKNDDKFFQAAYDLIKAGDISDEIFKRFCVENNIKVVTKYSRNITSWKNYTESSC